MPNGFTLSANMREMFFDREKVLARISKDKAKKLSKAGAYLRRRARTKLRRRKGPSAPGKPPSVHSNDDRATLKNILFALDESGDSVVVGPVGLPRFMLKESTAKTVPELMEFGGTTTNGRGSKKRKVKVAARPWMGPSLREEIEAGTFADLFMG